ncbi:valine--tRNA ligase [Patescibacteria group bacterium]|nr:MAG: valine--tRNA ligase [Patescibacteria group bacterium]
MNDKLLRPYDWKETEDRIYKTWESSGYFTHDTDKAAEKEVFSIALPPPNVTGELHMGHAFGLTIEDIMVRFHRMRGFTTLWLPGTDHAAIATQARVERLLYEKEQKTKKDIGRDVFLKSVDDFSQQNHDIIVNQIKKIGCSLDWTREAFTLDERRSIAVKEAFKRMFEAGLIYRGLRIVNWDPKLQTTLSDDELVYKEEKTPFYYLKYGPFTIGTARPETKFGDKYVVMHPDDKRYARFSHGQKISLEWINGPVTATVIKDSSIDIEFGTGAMTITPWHDRTDFEIAERHNLEKEQIIDLTGKLTGVAGEFAGMHIKKARPLIIEKLKAKGLVERVDEHYTHNVAVSERSGKTVEPQILRQWFVSVNSKFRIENSKIDGIPSGSDTTLKEIMRKTVESGQIQMIPDRFVKIYFHWIDNLRDWCISRQIWYGHRIPVWYRPKADQPRAGEEIYVGVTPPAGAGWTQDEDTLDTWFSAGLWTFSTLGWPEETDDLRLFHPTSVLETGYDILFFWVARMILMSGFLLGDIPFRKVYLHGLVRDERGQKLSKSLGNAGDPLAMITKYGADALRMALIVGAGAGNDSKISEEKIKAYKHFANKIWNATRFVLESINSTSLQSLPQVRELSSSNPRIAALKNHIAELDLLVAELTNDLESFRFHLAAEKLYHYFWHTFADKIIEESKPHLKGGSPEERFAAEASLLEILSSCLKLLHPFMPFITEELWSYLPKGRQTLLMVEPWPTLSS